MRGETEQNRASELVEKEHFLKKRESVVAIYIRGRRKNPFSQDSPGRIRGTLWLFTAGKSRAWKNG